MMQLFIRLYMGVTVTLFIAICIMMFAFHYRMDTDFSIVKERAMKGGVKRGRELLDAKHADTYSTALKKLQAEYNYPIQIISIDEIPVAIEQSMSNSDEVMIQAGNQLSVFVRLKDGTSILQLGPVELSQGIVEADMLIVLSAMLLLVAMALALLMRPLNRQLSMLEKTAISIADGNLSARVDIDRTDSAKTLARAFNQMASRTETLLRTQRELLQAVSHELRTPLARINFAIDLIRTARNAQEREPRLKSLDTAAQELDRLVDELLQYVRLETNDVSAEREEIDLLLLVNELLEKAAFVSQTVQFNVGTELSKGEIQVTADQSGLARILSNLLANASRFARQTVTVDAQSSTTGTTIDVDDDGPGIPLQDRERVFEPFVRLEDDGCGVGLGLALVKRIVVSHGGHVIALESKTGGCRIRTFWPTTNNS